MGNGSSGKVQLFCGDPFPVNQDVMSKVNMSSRPIKEKGVESF